MPFYYVAGDIGGTNARLHLYLVPEKGDEELIAERYYKSQDFNSLTAIVFRFLSDVNMEEIPNSACFSLAGPVKNGIVKLTNIGWSSISEKEMESELGIKKITFLNDFAANGYGIQLLEKEDLFEISNNKLPEPNGPKVIIGAGTGLGEAFIFRKDSESIVVPGEGGHTDFAPRNKIEFDLMIYIRKKINLSRVGVERVISGPGIEMIYWFFVDNNPGLENKEVSDIIRSDRTPGKIISEFAIGKKDLICEKALKLFIGCYGAEAGNMALSVLPTGGVYVAGGIAPQIRDIIKDEFMDSFLNKGRMRTLLAGYPVYIVTNPSIGILGARFMGRRTIDDKDKKLDRNLSFGDIKSMSSGINLLSETPKTYNIKEKPKNVRPWATSASERIFETSSCEERSVRLVKNRTMENLLCVGAGICFSGLILAAFLLGKNSSKK